MELETLFVTVIVVVCVVASLWTRRPVARRTAGLGIRGRSQPRQASAAGPGLESLDLPPACRRALRDHGVVTLAQFYDFVHRYRRTDLASRTFGTSLADLRGRFATPLGTMLPGAVRARLDAPFFTRPRPAGLRGPADRSPILAARRSRYRAPREHLAREVRAQIRKGGLPTKVLLTPYMTPVGDQGNLGSCCGWGSTANREMLARTALAPRWAYEGAKRLDGMPNEEGTWQAFCMQWIVGRGHLREEIYPYTDERGRRPVEPFFDQAEEYKADSYMDVLLDPEDMEIQPQAIKAILAGRLTGELGPQPVSVSVGLFESFDSASTAQFGLVTVPLNGEQLLGGHAMTIAGFIDGDDPDGLYGTDYFIVKNSWSDAWAPANPVGLPGYGLFPTAFFTSAERVWELLVVKAERSPARCGVLDYLRMGYDERIVAPPVAVGVQ